jgi:hypothetical protein
MRTLLLQLFDGTPTVKNKAVNSICFVTIQRIENCGELAPSPDGEGWGEEN